MPFNKFKPIVSAVHNNRDHRKIMIIDGNIAFNGGINLADEYINVKKRFGHWKDSNVMLYGEAVKTFTIMFLEVWNVLKHTDENYDDFLSKNPNANIYYSTRYGHRPLSSFDFKISGIFL